MTASPPIFDLLRPVLQHASSLPAMPEVAARLLDSLERDSITLDEITALIARDPALAVKVLRLANSARYGGSHGARTLRDAASSLGLRTLRDLTLAACLVGAFPVHPGLDRVAFWQGAIATSVCARHLAAPLGQDADVAWLCGLLLRSGQLLMLQFDAQRTLQAQRLAGLAVDAVMGYERSLIGCSHPEVTAELARHWRFPPALVQALAAAADPLELRPFNRLGATLRLASVAADVRRVGVAMAQALPEVQGDLLQHVQLSAADIDGWLPPWSGITSGVDELIH
ncbi:HDOD domain-containing protein [Amphibiibacter pelophylacis]|uniref:HDOD domain-containing protein n=1 Tax=Amphibiibacter pelophylacis TaxID=1799477 RepID=A0ACC6P1G8_9BURK